MKAEFLPDKFLDKIADPAERKRLTGSPLTSPERIAKEDAKLERELHKLISQELNRRQIPFIHSRTDKKTTQQKGIPDFVFVINGQPFAVECKTAVGALTKEQESILTDMKKSGWTVSVCRSFVEFLTVIQPSP